MLRTQCLTASSLCCWVALRIHSLQSIRERSWSVSDDLAAVKEVAEDLLHLSRWITGCDCHSPQSPGFAACPFKGLRARTLAGQVQSTIKALQRRRDALRPFAYGAIDTMSVFQALNNTISLLRTKFLWLEEVPYLVWKVHGRCSF